MTLWPAIALGLYVLGIANSFLAFRQNVDAKFSMFALICTALIWPFWSLIFIAINALDARRARRRPSNDELTKNWRDWQT